MTLLEFLKHIYAPSNLNLSEESEEQLAIAVRRLNAHAGHPVTLDELTKELLAEWLKSLTKSSATATVNGKRSSIMTLWRAAHRLGKAARPPESWEIPSMRARRRMPNSWTVEEMERILSVCRGIRGRFRLSGIPKADFLASLIVFQYETGTRLSASLAVEAKDLNLETGLVMLRYDTAKTGLEQAHWLSDQAIELIATHWDGKRRMVWPFGPNRNGLWTSLKSVLKAAGLPFDRRSMFHRIRRTTATILTARAGLSMASAALGHTSEAMTRGSYVDPTKLGIPKPIDVLPRLNG